MLPAGDLVQNHVALVHETKGKQVADWWMAVAAFLVPVAGGLAWAYHPDAYLGQHAFVVTMVGILIVCLGVLLPSYDIYTASREIKNATATATDTYQELMPKIKSDTGGGNSTNNSGDIPRKKSVRAIIG